MKRVAACCALLLLACAVAGGQQDWPPALQELFSKGVEAQKAGRLEEAERILLEVLKRDGKASFVHNNLGIVYQQRGDHARAIDQFREALRIEPGYPQPRALLGSSLLATGRVQEAVKELEQAVKLLPREPLVRLSLARAYERLGDLQAQVDQIRALRELAPKELEYAYLLGRSYARLSAACYEKIARLHPASARYHQVAGETYFMQGQPERAVTALERAVKADPRLPGLHLLLAQIYMQQGKRTEARQEVERELAVMPGSAMALALRNQLN